MAHVLYARAGDASGDSVAGLDLPPESRSSAEVATEAQLRDVARDSTLRVAVDPAGPWLTLVDALENEPRARDRALELSPDPTIDRWRRGRWLTLGAPVAWASFTAMELRDLLDLRQKITSILSSDAVKTAEGDPEQRESVGKLRAKLESALSLREVYLGVEMLTAVVALFVVVRGLRRWRPIVVAIGFAGAIWALNRSLADDACVVHGGVASFGWLAAAMLGASGAIASIALVASETKVVVDLRARLGLPERGADAPLFDRFPAVQREDLGATFGAASAGLALPLLLIAMLGWRIDDRARAFVFIGTCTIAFFGFLALRRDTSRAKPDFVRIALAAVAGFGVVAAWDIVARSGLDASIALRSCLALGTKALQAIHDAAAKETTGARHDTQSSPFNMFLTIIIAPISEELLYRGSLQRVARRAIGARSAIVISGVVFGVAHMFAFPTAFFEHFALGLAFASVFEIAGGGVTAVLASAGAHLLWNLYLSILPTG